MMLGRRKSKREIELVELTGKRLIHVNFSVGPSVRPSVPSNFQKKNMGPKRPKMA